MLPTEQRFRSLGLELGGGKSARTAMVVLDYYAKEKKVFLVDSILHLHGTRIETGDEVLIETVLRYKANSLSVNAPLTLPPCLPCKLKCPTFRFCKVPEVVWMREEGNRLGWEALKAPTPYTQRPIDVASRNLLQQGLAIDIPVDETLGAGPAPLAARMQYLQRHLAPLQMLEVNPRLVMARLSEWFDISARHLKRYRDISEGLEQRLHIIRAIAAGYEDNLPTLFLYEEDIESICREISLFDAFVSALMGIYHDARLTADPLPGFQASWGMSIVPKRRIRPTPRRPQLEQD